MDRHVMERMEAALTHDARHSASFRDGDLLTTITSLRTEVEALRRREAIHRATLGQLHDQLRLASSLQQNLQTTLSDVHGLTIRTLYHPAGVVSGDMYKTARLDEYRVAISVTDATGHDLAAALLSVFAKRSLRGKERFAHGYRILEPDEVLARANAEIREADLEECHFVTATYAIYDERTRRLRWARAGAPHPIIHRPGQALRPMVSEGPLLCGLDNPTFEVVDTQLEPGDTLIFHTDGLEEFLVDGHHGRVPALDAVADRFADLEEHAFVDVLDRLDRDLGDTDHHRPGRDDVTVVALHATGQPPPRRPRRRV